MLQLDDLHLLLLHPATGQGNSLTLAMDCNWGNLPTLLNEFSEGKNTNIHKFRIHTKELLYNHWRSVLQVSTKNVMLHAVRAAYLGLPGTQINSY